MIKLDIKPLSQNKAYTGRRFKTDAYRSFKKELLWTLPPLEVERAKYRLDIIWGFSNSLSDVTNPLKIFEDVLQERYKFNDRNVFDTRIRKVIVKKNKDFIMFNIEPVQNDCEVCGLSLDQDKCIVCYLTKTNQYE